MITLDKVTKWYGKFKVLDACSTKVERSEVVVVCGPSGSGKSTLIKCVNGLEPFQSGSLIVDGIDVGARETNLPRLRARIGMVFQNFELFPHLSVLRNVTLAQERVLKRDRADAERRARELLERVGLADKADAFPAQCSGGQQQRVAIARALALDPHLMLFDEPTSALDPELGAEVLSVMRLLAEEGMTMMIVTHEMHFAEQVSDSVVVMHEGAVLEEGPPEVVFKRPVHERTRRFLNAVLDR